MEEDKISNADSKNGSEDNEEGSIKNSTGSSDDSATENVGAEKLQTKDKNDGKGEIKTNKNTDDPKRLKMESSDNELEHSGKNKAQHEKKGAHAAKTDTNIGEVPKDRVGDKDIGKVPDERQQENVSKDKKGTACSLLSMFDKSKEPEQNQNETDDKQSLESSENRVQEKEDLEKAKFSNKSTSNGSEKVNVKESSQSESSENSRKGTPKKNWGHKQVEVNIKTMMGEVIPVKVRLDDTVEEMKILLYHATGLFPDQQVLVFEGVELEDEKELGSYGIEDGLEISLSPRVNSGFIPPPE